MKGFLFWGETESAQWQTGEGVVSPQNSHPPPYHGRRYDSGDGGARNVLTWIELGGLGNLIKCGEIRVLGGNFAGRTSQGQRYPDAFFCARAVNRKLHYTRGVSEYNVLRQ